MLMAYWFRLTILQIGFWLTWSLIPIVVEIIPAVFSAGILLFKQFRKKRLEMPAKMPLITVIVPVYNSEDTLFNCIRSIENSTYPSDLIQIILADNQSTDNSFQAFAHAQNVFTDLHMQLIHTDQGKAKALNSAIYESIGTYIINIDSDGILEKHALMNMVLRFENDYDVSALTGTILPQKKLIKQTRGFWRRLLQRNEYFEYAQAFLSGRTIESENNQLFTMSGAFSAFRKEALMSTFLYSTTTIGEDTDMTFQLRERLKRKVVICSDAIFYIEPIPSLGQLYTQRQRWQRGEIEVTQAYSTRIEIKHFFNNFLIRRMILDHTFLFPRMIWLFASLVLLLFNYSPVLLGMSYVVIYLLYVMMEIMNFVCVQLLLGDFPDERHFYSSQWWVALTMPAYNFICAWIRFVGIINSMTELSHWNSTKFDAETRDIRTVIRDDIYRFKSKRR
ncbi:glycosyltransferase [Pediococcus cellicola]|uniref:Glycosyltransferase n=2 Tax=Pediococcus cellicola TaxID=319652 RepID=A0A0R2IP49_9LACO|nr:glycosyltransferase [Pediococcus cellicola]